MLVLLLDGMAKPVQTEAELRTPEQVPERFDSDVDGVIDVHVDRVVAVACIEFLAQHWIVGMAETLQRPGSRYARFTDRHCLVSHPGMETGTDLGIDGWELFVAVRASDHEVRVPFVRIVARSTRRVLVFISLRIPHLHRMHGWNRLGIRIAQNSESQSWKIRTGDPVQGVGQALRRVAECLGLFVRTDGFQRFER